jgi:hydroxymethylglutaryl-CoA reductase
LNSRIPGFYRRAPAERREAALAAAGVDPALGAAFDAGALALDVADAMVENVIGTFALPSALAVNLHVNGRDRLVPMVVEEPSVVAAVSHMAKLCRDAGGVQASADPSVMIGQVQILGAPTGAADHLRAALPEISAAAAGVHEDLAALGGGLRGIEVRELRYDEPGEPPEDMVVVHFLLDCVDAMGANMVNTLAERLAPRLAEIAGGRAGLRILSNLADRRTATATVRLPGELLGAGPTRGGQVAAGIASAYRFAWVDPYRAATHNKGIMNGIDAVALATGNDWRAIEAGAHAYAARSGQYRPLSRWVIEGTELVGRLQLPLQVGTVGGPIRIHPTVQANLALAQVTGARDLAMLMAAVGLVQNLGALRALAEEGIQAGHMRMHARTVALAAGATAEELPRVVDALVAEGAYSTEKARAAVARARRD